MKHTVAPVKRVSVLSDLVTAAAAVAHLGCEVQNDLSDWLSRSRVARVVGQILVVLAVVFVLAVLSGCQPKNSQPGPIENTAVAVQ